MHRHPAPSDPEKVLSYYSYTLIPILASPSEKLFLKAGPLSTRISRGLPYKAVHPLTTFRAYSVDLFFVMNTLPYPVRVSTMVM